MKIKTIAQSTAAKTLRLAGIAQTPKRPAVPCLLQKTKTPFSAGKIHQNLCKQTCIDMFTLYLALSLFRNQGILSDVTTEGSALFVELPTSESPKHPRLRYFHCGVLACMPPISSGRLGELIDRAGCYRVDEANIPLTGLCASFGRIHAAEHATI